MVNWAIPHHSWRRDGQLLRPISGWRMGMRSFWPLLGKLQSTSKGNWHVEGIFQAKHAFYFIHALFPHHSLCWRTGARDRESLFLLDKTNGGNDRVSLIGCRHKVIINWPIINDIHCTWLDVAKANKWGHKQREVIKDHPCNVKNSAESSQACFLLYWK